MPVERPQSRCLPVRVLSIVTRAGMTRSAPASPPEIIKHMQEIEKGGADSGLTVDITNMIKLFDDFEDRYSADVDEHKQALARIEASIEKRLPRPSAGSRAV